MSTTLRMFTAVACCACAMTIARPSAQTGGAWFERFATELKNLPKPQTPPDASTELRRKDLAVVAAVIAPAAALEDNHEYKMSLGCSTSTQSPKSTRPWIARLLEAVPRGITAARYRRAPCVGPGGPGAHRRRRPSDVAGCLWRCRCHVLESRG